MSLTLQITHTLPAGRLRLQHLQALLANKSALNATVEVAAAGAVKSHLTTHYAGKVNGLGGASTGYWKTAIEGTTSQSDANGAMVNINQKGVRLKYEGGVIRASGRTSEVTGKPIRFLTIPVHPAAHGKTIADFGGKSGTYIVPFAAGAGLKEGGTGTGAGVFRRTGDKPSRSDPLYWILKRSVTIKSDKNILPPETAVTLAVNQALEIYLS